MPVRTEEKVSHMFSAIIGRRREFESRPSLLWYYIWPHDVLRFDLVIRHFVSFINLVPNRVCKSDLRGRFAEQGLGENWKLFCSQLLLRFRLCCVCAPCRCSRLSFSLTLFFIAGEVLSRSMNLC